MARLTKIEDCFGRLLPGDDCWHIGEFQSHGTYKAGETNQWISNLKANLRLHPNRAYYKDRAYTYWAQKLAESLNVEVILRDVTFIPAPCSKPVGHVDHDDRMLRVLLALQARVGNLDIRELITTKAEREAQHTAGRRFSPEELQGTMQVNPSLLSTPLRPMVIVVDDVFTQGSTFRAMKTLIQGLPPPNRPRNVGGLFLARTVWPIPTAVDFGFVNEDA